MEIIGVCAAPIFDETAFRDNWVRTFREIPEFDRLELDMMRQWASDEQFEEIAIFLTGEEYKDLDEEMAEFLIRELLRGKL
ncbi:MAG: hypothetical protein ABIE47_08145 [Pseudomonadota bacterium]